MVVDNFDRGLRSYFTGATDQLYKIALKLRTRSYTLARASESEILAQFLKRPVTASVTRQQLHEVASKPSVAGSHLVHRINLYVDKLRRKIVSYAQALALSAKNEHEFAEGITAAFPRARRVQLPRRILKPKLMESVRPDFSQSIADDTDVAIDNIDEDAWNDMLDTYMNDYVPKTRGPEYIIDKPEVTGQDTWYAWEFERDMTDEFVQSVRDGTQEAAKENGITDFVWIAVIDSHTDKCCAWRDGLLVSEIKAQMDDHEEEDADCNDGGSGLTPPIHFNCRCTLAPATDEIPDKPDDGAKDFADWLET